MLQIIPEGKYVVSVLPSNDNSADFSNFVPKPDSPGGPTRGPPLSSHLICKRCSFKVHSTCSSPVELAKAPYFAAFVANSWPAVPARIAGTARWYVVRCEALWPPRRNLIPKGGVGSPIGVGRGSDFLTGFETSQISLT